MPDAPDFTPLETAVLAILRSAKGKPVRGRTRLQKLAFLLAHLPGTPELREETSFEALHFGPFSEALNDTRPSGVAYAGTQGLFFENNEEASIASVEDPLTFHTCRDSLL